MSSPCPNWYCRTEAILPQAGDTNVSGQVQGHHQVSEVMQIINQLFVTAKLGSRLKYFCS